MIDPLVLPFPPSGNTYYRSIRMGQSCRVLISKRGREYKQTVSDMIEAIDDPPFPPFPNTSRLGISITLHAPTRRKYDIDNFTKALFDALESAGVIENDNQFDVMTVKRGEVIRGGRAIVYLYELPEKSVAPTK
jgi:crossover junction endodeoxyribonuclease RusA